ncbi:MAG: hypothetical protein AB1668_00915 [Nanoarchaeota archaeon]
MVKNRFCLLLVVLIFLLALICSAADFDTGELCLSDDDCTSLNENGYKHYCNTENGAYTCFRIVEEEGNGSEAGGNESKQVAAPLSEDLDSKVASLEEKIAAVESEIASLKSKSENTAGDILTLQSTLNSLQEEVNILRQQQESGLQQLNSQVSVGLAGMQQDIDETKSELSGVKETVDAEKTQSRIITITIFVLLAVAVAVGLIYYFSRKGSFGSFSGMAAGAPAVSPEIVNYITSHIKQGSKYPQIKDSLLKAGWSEEDIDWAYKETIKHNYRRFKAGDGGAAKIAGTAERVGAGRAVKGLSSDRAKIITILVVSILLVAGVILILQGTVGKAIFYGKEIVEGGKVQYTVSCTPPHILTPEGDACCLDNKTVYSNGSVLLGAPNGLCDAAERVIEEAVAGGVAGGCTDNSQCLSEGLSGSYCIDGQCRTLASFYKGIGDCSRLCEIYGVKISTSDGETYDTRPKKGSYTAAGALEWKVMTMPAHCKGEPPATAIKIIRKKPGQIVNEEVVVLKEKQISKVLTHPDFSSIAFTLKAERIFYICPE